MRILAKTVAVTTIAGAAIVFAAPAASSQTSVDGTIDYDIALLFVSISLGGNASATLPVNTDGATSAPASGTTADEPDNGVAVNATLPVEQQVVDAHNTETGYRVELLPTNGNGNAAVQPLDADANGAAVGSPGVISGNTIQIPIHLPINLCGNSIDIVGLLNATSGNTCVNS